jgi:hypothetical protein
VHLDVLGIDAELVFEILPNMPSWATSSVNVKYVLDSAVTSIRTTPPTETAEPSSTNDTCPAT